ncbi:MAG: DMT family transporter [Rhodomicrobium sp.]|nr:DMT family transporter [Rhodomicrobium sp.]
MLTMLFWAGNSVVARGVHELVPPLALAWLRWTIATLIVLPIAWPYIKRDWPVMRARWRSLVMLGALGTGSFNSLYYIGVSKTPAINALVINSSVPLLIPIAVFVIFRETLSRIQAAGIGFSLAGVLMVLAKGNPAFLASMQLNEGDLWVLAAMTIWAIYTALLRKQPPIHWLSFAAATFAVASLMNLPLFIGEHMAGKTIQPGWHAFLAVAYVSTMPSVVAQICYIRGVELIGSNRAGVFMHLIPLFGTILAILFLGESLYLYHLAGFALILTGVALASRPRAPPPLILRRNHLALGRPFDLVGQRNLLLLLRLQLEAPGKKAQLVVIVALARAGGHRQKLDRDLLVLGDRHLIDDDDRHRPVVQVLDRDPEMLLVGRDAADDARLALGALQLDPRDLDRVVRSETQLLFLPACGERQEAAPDEDAVPVERNRAGQQRGDGVMCEFGVQIGFGVELGHREDEKRGLQFLHADQHLLLTDAGFDRDALQEREGGLIGRCLDLGAALFGAHVSLARGLLFLDRLSRCWWFRHTPPSVVRRQRARLGPEDDFG